MSDPLPSVIALGVLVLLAVLVLGAQLVPIVRDSDAWLIARGVTSGKVNRLRRFVRRVRRG